MFFIADYNCQSSSRMSCFHMLSLIISNHPPPSHHSIVKVLSRCLVCPYTYAELALTFFHTYFCFCFLLTSLSVASHPISPVTPAGHNHEWISKKIYFLRWYFVTSLSWRAGLGPNPGPESVQSWVVSIGFATHMCTIVRPKWILQVCL
jgi:hypothetical protein